MKACPNFKKLIVGNDDENGRGVIVRGRCKQWKCEYCATRNAMVWMYRIRDTVEQSNQIWSFVTFTAPSKKRTPRSSLSALQDGWEKFREALRHKRGKNKFKYLRVYEMHKDGSYHLHAIIEHQFDDIKIANKGKSSEYPYSRWIKDNAVKWGFGYINSAGNFRGGSTYWNVGRYIAKYMTKGDERIENGVRRFQASHGFAKPDAVESSIQWQVFDDYNVRDLFEHLESYDYVKDLTTGEMVTYAEVNENRTYREWIYGELVF
uniref:Replication-associated protein ORF2/G2P domain-containing protein n=1 Tax=uncultured prokaryote TaxID=198431 RepID=A0A0H5Q970_9ZZZZ|nr:hypothetical protein [uncultured prokaryote]